MVRLFWFTVAIFMRGNDVDISVWSISLITALLATIDIQETSAVTYILVLDPGGSRQLAE